MDTRLAKWGVELGFFRTRVGKEFDLINRLVQKGSELPVFFGTYGYFDLAAIKCIETLSVPSLVPLDHDLLESAPFRFFSDAANQAEDFLKDLRDWRSGIAVFLKIDPALFQADPCGTRWKTAAYLKAHFGSVHVFFGLGYSELLVLTGGNDLPSLLETVTQLRDLQKAEESPGQPSFVRTTTFPLVSYEQIHQPQAYHLLSGTVHPVVAITCAPTSEEAILQSLPEGLSTRNIYGDSDLVVYWPSISGIEFGQFAKFITDFRSEWANSDEVVKTTSYLETVRGKGALLPTREKCKREIEPIHPKLFEKLEILQPLALRASVADVVLRLSSCVHDQIVGNDYRDMLKTFPYIEDIVDVLVKNQDHLDVMKARFTLTEISDLARSAINQRHAGLEAHPETLAHSQSPVLCDIRSLILAASSLPQFVFDNLYPNRKDLWAGYVLFGSTYWPLQYQDQNILALPAASIFRPIEEWWKITHEVAHAVYGLLQPDQKLEPAIYDLLQNVYDDSPTSVERVINELFANWFDWRYIFDRDTEFFLRIIWTSWLSFPVVWEHKHQYLVRSFAVSLTSSFEELRRTLSAGRSIDHLVPFLEEKWRNFKDILLGLPHADLYFSDIDGLMLDDIFRQILSISALLDFFETRFEAACGVGGLHDRLNPPYSKLDLHVTSIIAGEVVFEDLRNPCKLHLSILKSLAGQSPSLATEVAYVLSLEHWFVRVTAEQAPL